MNSNKDKGNDTFTKKTEKVAEKTHKKQRYMIKNETIIRDQTQQTLLVRPHR